MESVTRKFDQDEEIVFSYRSEIIINNDHNINFKEIKRVIYKGFTPIYFKPKLKVMVMETKNKKCYALIGNDFYSLIQVKDEHLHGNMKHYLIRNLKLLKYQKLIILGKQLADIFLIEKEKIQDIFIR
ncbi:hypothetical protein [Spiroplasma endosymbiont of Cantharis nigra]|uniref:hypothetical protein n=1 Tax=Spiroplasma endosymbiont of Cantharis nigra TaxID=3066278 RepID=UPI0030CBEFF9